MRVLSLILLTFASLLGVSFAILNSELVTIHYFLGVAEIPLSVLVLGIWVVGILLGVLASSFTILKLKMELHRARRDHG